MAAPVDLPEKPEKAAPPEKDIDPSLKVANWADNEETVKKVLERAKTYFTKFDSQSNRDKMEEDLKHSDQMFRMAKGQTKQDENKTRDAIDTVPDAFFRALRAVTANDNETLYAQDEIGASYKPLDTIDGDSRDDAMYRANLQKVLLEYSFEIDNRKAALQDFQWYVNKNCNGMVGMEWLYDEKIDRYRKPIYDKEGKPNGSKWVTEKVIRQHPHFTTYGIDNVWLDAMIKDIQKQQCILMRSYPVLTDLLSKQKSGAYKNISKLTNDQLFKTEQPSNVQQDVHDNADTGGSSDVPTGEFDQWDVVMFAPIDTDGKWDDTIFPRRIMATFEGHISQSNPVCVKLNPNAYDPDDNGEIPYFWQSSHWDEENKGAYSLGFVHLLWPAYQEYKTTLDQWFDNKNLQLNANWITERGAIHTSDKTFGPRRLMEMQMGMIDKLKRIEVPSVTGDMQAFIAYIEARIKETAGTTDPFLGQPMGSRTSASEARQAFEQSMKPSNDRLRMMSRLLEWIALWDMRMWRMFADPKLTFSLVNQGSLEEIKPAEIWGPLRVKVTAIDDYKTNVMVQREQDAFIRDTFPAVKDTMGKRNANNLLRWIYRARDFPVDEIFETEKEGDAAHIATSENRAFQNGIWDQPKPDQNHEVHMAIHGNARNLFKMMPDGDIAEDAMNLINAHIEIHKQMQEAEFASATQAGAPQLPGGVGTGQEGAAPPRTIGEGDGDIIAGEAGSIQ